MESNRRPGKGAIRTKKSTDQSKTFSRSRKKSISSSEFSQSKTGGDHSDPNSKRTNTYRSVKSGDTKKPGENTSSRNNLASRTIRKENDTPEKGRFSKGSNPTERKPVRGFDKSGRENRQDKKGSKFSSPKSEREYKRSRPVNSQSTASDEGLIRLNKYIANSGICSRREADELIAAGTVMVNGKVVTELGTKVSPSDKVQYDDHIIRSERHVYVLLNKPKGYITTTDDPFDRKTVMSLVANACKERIYPVGRLDRNTTGLLLLTNDGDLAKKLTHPRHTVKKIYQVELDKPLSKNDMLTIAGGVELEDGLAVIDEIAYTSDGSSKKEIGVELHSGKNRIVRRIFEAIGYEVVKLDRVVFAGLTKKDLPRGQWRMLSEQEVSYLKMLK